MPSANLEGGIKVEMARISEGCPEACSHCGAYRDFDSTSLRVITLTTEEIRKNLLLYKNILAPFLTTDVNLEPLRTDAFGSYVNAVYDLTDGESRVVEISHGVRSGNKSMKKRLMYNTELMKQKKIPLFVLSMDQLRNRGRISFPENKSSYMATLEILQEVMRDVRVTVSMQAEDVDNLKRIEDMLEEIQKDLAWTLDDKKFLHIDKRVGYTKVGRACLFESDNDCDVIPDHEFLQQAEESGIWKRRDYLWRGRINMDGSLLIQPNRIGRTYGDSVLDGKWELVE